MFDRIYSRVLRFRLLRQGTKIGYSSRFNFGVSINSLVHKIIMGDFVSLDRNVTILLTPTRDNASIPNIITIGNQVYINRNSMLDATSGIQIGDDCMIGPNVYITDHDHSFQETSIHTKLSDLPLIGQPVTIGKNVWIGANSIILKGVKIGENVIIGAGSVVTRDIPDSSVAVGNPCKVIKNRV